MPVLELKNLKKTYRGVPVVNDVSFRVEPGELTGYLGPNGSGKSTTVKMIVGLIEPNHGAVLLDGRDVRKDLVGFRRRLGYVPEEAVLYPYLTGLEYLQLVGRLREVPEAELERKANDLLELFSLHPFRHGAIATYSKGMRQRILISAALLHNPEILILDEPLSGMDVTSAQLFQHLLDELASSGKTILYISHVLEVVEKVCARVVVLHRGRMVANDTVDRLRGMMNLPTLVDIFSELTEERDLRSVARDIVAAL